jgi:hypothetical protein
VRDDDPATRARPIDAVAVDVKVAPNHARVHEALCVAYPQLRGRVRFVQSRLEQFALTRDDLVVSAHACAHLTDKVIAHAAAAGARVSVLPCCHAYRRRPDLMATDDPALAMDVERATRLEQRGYRVDTRTIPPEVSPKNRLLLGAPTSSSGPETRCRLVATPRSC